MVGDSFEDVEVGNAAGTATCLVAGGGNEKPGKCDQKPILHGFDLNISARAAY